MSDDSLDLEIGPRCPRSGEEHGERWLRLTTVGGVPRRRCDECGYEVPAH